MSSTHKALAIDSKFGKFVIVTHPTPKPGAGELLVRIEAAGLNPVDWKIRKYGIFVENYPAVIGTDVAGVVEEVGEGVTSFSKGDRVVYQGDWSPDFAGFQQYSLTKAETTAKIPDNVTTDEAATIPVAIGVGVVGLYNPRPKGAALASPFEPSGRNKYAGQPLVVLGGGSSVGQFALQLGRLSGFSPIITTASLKHSSFLKELGATHVIDRHILLDQISAEVAKITTAPIRTVYDSIASREIKQAGYDLLAAGGQLISVMQTAIDVVPEKEVVNALGIFTIPETKDLGVSFYGSLTKLLADGELKPNRVEVVPGGLNGIVEGLARLENDQVSGYKLVVHPHETT